MENKKKTKNKSKKELNALDKTGKKDVKLHGKNRPST